MDVINLSFLFMKSCLKRRWWIAHYNAKEIKRRRAELYLCNNSNCLRHTFFDLRKNRNSTSFPPSLTEFSF